MRAWAFCGLLALTAGCATFDRTSDPLVLSPREEEFAAALARFGYGLVLEDEEGRQSERAANAFAEASRLDPERHLLAAKAALIRLQRNQADKALAQLQESCRLNPESFQAWLDLAAVAQVTGNVDVAARAYRSAIRLDPAAVFPRVSLSKLHFLKREDAEALRVVRAGLDIAVSAPGLLSFGYSQAREFISRGEISRSIPCFRLVAERTPTQRNQFFTLLGELYQGLGYRDEALHYFERAIRESPPLPDAFLKKALFHFPSEPQKSADLLERASRLIPRHPGILFLLGSTYNRMERFREAAAVFERIEPLIAEASETLSASFFLQYGSACERSGQPDQAETVFLRGLESYPDDPQILNYLAYMWAERGVSLDRALDFVHRALVADPENGAYIDTLGWIYFKKRMYREALEQVQKAHALVSDDAVVNDHLGDAYHAMDDPDLALSFWKQSFLLDPSNEAVAGKLTTNGVNPGALLRQHRKDRPRDAGKD